MSPSTSSLQSLANAVDPAAVDTATTAVNSATAGAAKLRAQAADAAATAANDASGASGTPPVSFTDLLQRAAAKTAAQSTTAAPSLAAQVAAAQSTAAQSAAIQSVAAKTSAAKAAAAKAVASATTSAAGAPTTTAASTSAAVATPDNPLAGLQAILFSGPLQTPPTSSQIVSQEQLVQTALKTAAPTASADALAGWKSTLTAMTQQLDAVEKNATGVDPTAAPAGWSEPANFQAARSLLNSLQATVSQAQAAQGTVVLAAQTATSNATLTAQGLQAMGVRFLPAQPRGQTASRLLGGAGEGAKAQSQTQAAAGDASPFTASTSAPPTASVAAAANSAASAAKGGLASEAASEKAAAPPQASLPVDPEQTAKALATARAGDAPQATPVVRAVAASTQSQATTGVTAVKAQSETSAGIAATAVADAGQGATPVAAQAAAQAAQASAANPTPNTTAAAAAPAAVAMLSSEIVKQANGQKTSFNLELHPADLGKVSVKLDIQADGQLAARMSFDNPAAAANLQAHSDDLRRSLEQAGFQVSGDALSFTSNGGQNAGGGAASSGGQNSSGQNSAGQNSAGQSDLGARAFAGAQAAAATAADTLSDPFQNRQAIGLDVRI